MLVTKYSKLYTFTPGCLHLMVNKRTLWLHFSFANASCGKHACYFLFGHPKAGALSHLPQCCNLALNLIFLLPWLLMTRITGWIWSASVQLLEYRDLRYLQYWRNCTDRGCYTWIRGSGYRCLRLQPAFTRVWAISVKKRISFAKSWGVSWTSSCVAERKMGSQIRQVYPQHQD